MVQFKAKMKDNSEKIVDVKEHWDLRWKISEDHKQELNIFSNPIDLEMEKPVEAVFKDIKETPEEVKYWMITEGKKVERKVGDLTTFVDVLDHGSITIIEQTPEFISMNIDGEKLKGYCIAKKTEKGWIFQKAELPKAQMLAGGDPKTGPYRPFIKQQKKGWDYYWLYLYDMKEFTRCVEDYKKYLPDLTLPNYVQEISVCLYPRPGTIHGARVTALKIDADKDQKEVESWVKREKLDTWAGALIREEKCIPCEESKLDELPIETRKEEKPKTPAEMTDEELDATVTEILKRIKKKVTETEDKDELEKKKLELELKKKKLELINKWLEANKD